jgi:hypothetical protein
MKNLLRSNWNVFIEPLPRNGRTPQYISIDFLRLTLTQPT